MGESGSFESFESKLEFAVTEANRLTKQFAAIHAEDEFGLRPESLLPSTREQLKLAFGVIVIHAKLMGTLTEKAEQEYRSEYTSLSKYIPDTGLNAIREYNKMIEADASTMNKASRLRWEEEVDVLERRAMNALQDAQDMKVSMREEFQLLLTTS